MSKWFWLTHEPWLIHTACPYSRTMAHTHSVSILAHHGSYTRRPYSRTMAHTHGVHTHAPWLIHTASILTHHGSYTRRPYSRTMAHTHGVHTHAPWLIHTASILTHHGSYTRRPYSRTMAHTHGVHTHAPWLIHTASILTQPRSSTRKPSTVFTLTKQCLNLSRAAGYWPDLRHALPHAAQTECVSKLHLVDTSTAKWGRSSSSKRSRRRLQEHNKNRGQCIRIRMVEKYTAFVQQFVHWQVVKTWH